MNGAIVELSDFYLIQGVFFQRTDGLRLSCEPVVGMTLWHQRYMGNFFFSGLIQRDPHHVLGGYKGHLSDRYGESTLTDIDLAYDMLRFNKTYTGRNYAIEYQFTLQKDGTWLGMYISKETGAGCSRCVLAPITEEFFTVPPIPQEAT